MRWKPARRTSESIASLATRAGFEIEWQDAHEVMRRVPDTTLAALQMYESGRRTGPIGMLVHPPAAFLRNYVLRRGFLDGTAGLTISMMNAWSVGLKFMKLWEMQRNPKAQIPNTKSQDRSNF